MLYDLGGSGRSLVATPTAITAATIKSIRPVALALLGFRLSASSLTQIAFVAHHFSTGCPLCASSSLSSIPSNVPASGKMSGTWHI